MGIIWNAWALLLATLLYAHSNVMGNKEHHHIVLLIISVLKCNILICLICQLTSWSLESWCSNCWMILQQPQTCRPLPNETPQAAHWGPRRAAPTGSLSEAGHRDHHHASIPGKVSRFQKCMRCTSLLSSICPSNIDNKIAFKLKSSPHSTTIQSLGRWISNHNCSEITEAKSTSDKSWDAFFSTLNTQNRMRGAGRTTARRRLHQ